jgi:hypothetical protein
VQAKERGAETTRARWSEETSFRSTTSADATAIPLSGSLSDDNRNDVTQLIRLVDVISPVRKPGRPGRAVGSSASPPTVATPRYAPSPILAPRGLSRESLAPTPSTAPASAVYRQIAERTFVWLK